MGHLKSKLASLLLSALVFVPLLAGLPSGEVLSADSPVTPMVALGDDFMVGLRSNGTVVAMGGNEYGQCDVGGWSGIVEIAAYGWHTVGLKSDGTVVAVGDNSAGQCNVGSWAGIRQVATGDSHTVGLKSDGTVVATGDNSDHQCDVGSWSGIQQVTAGVLHTVGLKSDGTVVVTEGNYNGAGNVSSWTGIQQVAAGFYYTVGLKSDGTVVAVGENDFGQCNVGSMTGIVKIAAGEWPTVGIRSDGTAVAVGECPSFTGQYNVGGWTDMVQVAVGEEGLIMGLRSDGEVMLAKERYQFVPGSCDVGSWAAIAQVAAGGVNTVGLKSDGTVVAVGDNSYGQCNVTSWTGIQQVATGEQHTVGLKSNGAVVAVGDNYDGQCNVSGWTGIVQVAAGGAHTVGLKSNGAVVAVGDNYDGCCNVQSWTGIQHVAAGSYYTVGLKSDGTVVAVGDNSYGQCNVTSWTGIQQVAAGFGHTVGLKSDGTVVAVRDNLYGQCNVTSWTGIQQVAAGVLHTVGLKSDGTVVAVGVDVELAKWNLGVTTPNRAPNQPTNVSPTGSGIDLMPTLQASVFSDPDTGDTQATSKWQIRTSSGSYSSAAFDSGSDTSHLTNITVPSGKLTYSTTYYWHVRYQDNHGAWSVWSQETSFATIAPPGPSQPVASFTYSSPHTPTWSGDIVQFDGSDSSGTIVSYDWDFGDGGTAIGHLVTHQFRGAMNQARTYTVTLTVKDATNATNSKTVDITVVPLTKTLQVTDQPMFPIPGQSVYAYMIASYNWIHDNYYVVSKVLYQSDGFLGIGAITIWDLHSSIIPKPLWAQDIISIHISNKAFYPILDTVLYGGDTFQGIRVDAFDAMSIQIVGWAGMSFEEEGSIPVPFHHESGSFFQPDNTDVPVIPSDSTSFQAIQLCSPGELRVSDAGGQTTGLINGVVKEEIPNSAYNSGIVVVLSCDPLIYDVVGTASGSYGLRIAYEKEGATTAFVGNGIPTTSGAIHQYTIDQNALSQGQQGVTVQVDSNGDGKFESTVNAGNELTHDDFVSATSKGGLPFWIWIIVGVGAVAVVGGGILIWRRLANEPVAIG